jgi:hypothetical protein
MNILRIIPSLDPKGGGPIEVARNIDSEHIRLNHNLVTLCLDDPKEIFLMEYPTQVHALGPSYLSYRFYRNKWLYTSCMSELRLSRSINPKVHKPLFPL